MGPRRSSTSMMLAGAVLGLAGLGGFAIPGVSRPFGGYPGRKPQKPGNRRPKARDGAQGGRRKSPR
jgi:hypothetical protein